MSKNILIVSIMFLFAGMCALLFSDEVGFDNVELKGVLSRIQLRGEPIQYQYQIEVFSAAKNNEKATIEQVILPPLPSGTENGIVAIYDKLVNKKVKIKATVIIHTLQIIEVKSITEESSDKKIEKPTNGGGDKNSKN